MHIIPYDENEEQSPAPNDTDITSISTEDNTNGVRLDNLDNTNIDLNRQSITNQQLCLSSSYASPVLSSSNDNMACNNLSDVSSLNYSVAANVFVEAASSSIQIISFILHEEARCVKKRVYEVMNNNDDEVITPTTVINEDKSTTSFGSLLNDNSNNKNQLENNVLNSTTTSSRRPNQSNEKRVKLRHMSSAAAAVAASSDDEKKKTKLSIQHQALRMKRMSNLLVQLDTLHLQILHEMKQCDVQQQQEIIMKEE